MAIAKTQDMPKYPKSLLHSLQKTFRSWFYKELDQPYFG